MRIFNEAEVACIIFFRSIFCTRDYGECDLGNSMLEIVPKEEKIIQR